MKQITNENDKNFILDNKFVSAEEICDLSKKYGGNGNVFKLETARKILTENGHSVREKI